MNATETSGLRTVRVLFEHRGENSDTAYSPVREMAPEETVPVEARTCCLYYDDNQLVTINRFKELNLTLPSWLTVEEFASHPSQWTFMWAMGVEKTWSEEWQRRLVRLNSESQYAYAKLLKTKSFRSEFRKSLRAQLETWLNGSGAYASPFSPKQQSCVVNGYLAREAKNAATSHYYHLRYHEV